MRHICVVITARPSYSRVKSVLTALNKRVDVRLSVVASASALSSRYGSVVDQIRSDGLPVTAEVHNLLDSDTPIAMAKTTGLGILDLSEILDRLSPDIVVTIADRYETLATAIAASYQNIPLAHIQGGEISGSIDDKVRNSVTALADLHFPATELAASRVRQMCRKTKFVFRVGCPSIDIAAQVKDVGQLSFDPYLKYGGVGDFPILENGFIVVMLHSVTSEHELAEQQTQMVVEAVSRVQMPVLWFWPNVDSGSGGISKSLRRFRENVDSSRFHFFRNMAPSDFLEVLRHTRCIVGNSSVAIRECEFLGTPAVNIGSRQLNRERGNNVIDVPFDVSAISEAVVIQSQGNRKVSQHLYGDGKSGERIAEVLLDFDVDELGQ